MGEQGFYLAALGVAVGVALTLRSRAWRWQAARLVRRPVGGADLVAVELAYLTSGADRATLVACLRLTEAGAVKVPEPITSRSPDHDLVRRARGTPTIRVRGGRRRGLQPVESAVLRELREHTRGESLKAKLRQSREMQALHDDLVASGLLVDRLLARRLRLSSVALGAVAALGLVRFSVDATHNRPALFLSLALVGVTVALILSLRVPRLTRTGARMVQKEQARHLDAARLLIKAKKEKVLDRVRSSGTIEPSGNDQRDSRVVAAFGKTVMQRSTADTAAHFGFRPMRTTATDDTIWMRWVREPDDRVGHDLAGGGDDGGA